MNEFLKFIVGLEVIKLTIPIPIEELFVRYYLGKYRVRVLDRIKNKSYVRFLERGVVGNKKVGYREVEEGEYLFVYTRCCYRKKREL